jgi:hypothetical protein
MDSSGFKRFLLTQEGHHKTNHERGAEPVHAINAKQTQNLSHKYVCTIPEYYNIIYRNGKYTNLIDNK